MKPIEIGLVGIGKIARDQHIPALRANPRFHLAAAASRHTTVDGVKSFPTIEAMLDGCPALDAVALCTPPQAHYDAARLALARGKHVLLEKPPCGTTGQLDNLVAHARKVERTLYQTWHSQHAPGVEPAMRWLRARAIRHVRVRWMEDVRQWHPGQTWIWRAGGFGVFDPGINAISILTRILPMPFFVERAEMYIPSNCETPIAAEVLFKSDDGAAIQAAFDFRHAGVQTWDIEVETGDGMLKLSMGGAELTVDGLPAAGTACAPHSEYDSIYAHFADLIESRRSDVQARPFQLVADIFLLAKRHTVEAFAE